MNFSNIFTPIKNILSKKRKKDDEMTESDTESCSTPTTPSKFKNFPDTPIPSSTGKNFIIKLRRKKDNSPNTINKENPLQSNHFFNN
jgi:hypothetical protein